MSICRLRSSLLAAGLIAVLLPACGGQQLATAADSQTSDLTEGQPSEFAERGPAPAPSGSDHIHVPPELAVSNNCYVAFSDAVNSAGTGENTPVPRMEGTS